MSYEISETDILSYHCDRCGRCCQFITDQIIIETLDAFRMAKNPKLHCANPAEVYEKFAHPTFVPSLSEGGYPTFLLNAKEDDSCIFLKAGVCTIYESRPRICRTYPFVVHPASSRRELQILPLMDPFSKHFSGGSISMRQWLQQFLPKEDQDFLAAEYKAMTELLGLIKQMPPKKLLEATMEIIYLHYFDYDTDEPFLPQYNENMEKLKKTLTNLA